MPRSKQCSACCRQESIEKVGFTAGSKLTVRVSCSTSWRPMYGGNTLPGPFCATCTPCCDHARCVSSFARYPGAQAECGRVENNFANAPTASPISFFCVSLGKNRPFSGCSGSQYSYPTHGIRQ